MGSLSKHTRQCADALDRVRHGADAGTELVALLISSLSPLQKQVYADAIWLGGCITTRNLMDKYGVKANAASNVLNQIWHYGLFRREERVDENGLHYRYYVDEWVYPKKVHHE